MGISQWRLGMITKNEEGFSEYNINPEWYKNRKPGLSAVVRCYGDEEIIGICLESIIPLFDEIIVTYTPVKGDRTRDICESFMNPKIKCYEYPFKLRKCYGWFERNNRSYENFRAKSVHDLAYYSNWSMSKTTYEHIAPRWDVDQILRPKYANREFHDFIIQNYMVRVSGYNVLNRECNSVAKENPIQGPEVRFRKVNYLTYFTGSLCGSEGVSFMVMDTLPYDLTIGIPRTVYTWYQFLLGKIPLIKEPIFFHLKYNLNENKNKSIGKKDEFNLSPYHENLKADVPDFIMKTVDDYIDR